MVTFEEHVQRALDAVPEELAEVAQRRDRGRGREPEEPDLYGLFDLPEFLPAKVTIYRLPLKPTFRSPSGSSTRSA